MEWEAISAEECQKLVETMPNRVAVVLKAKGGYTKYWNPVSCLSKMPITKLFPEDVSKEHIIFWTFTTDDALKSPVMAART